MSSTIRRVLAREIFDSRGNPTIEVAVITEKGPFAAMVPSGASTGIHEALELRDGGKRLGGKGVLKAVKNAKDKLSKAVVGLDCIHQRTVDNAMLELDGTDNKSKMGANAILGLSMAVCRAGAAHSGRTLYQHLAELQNKPYGRLPVPQLNVINGGKHAGYDNDIQEYLLLPIGAKSFKDGFEHSVDFYHALKNSLKKKFGPSATHLGDEGGFVPPLPTPHERLEFLTKTMEELGQKKIMKFGVDAASSEFFNKGNYTIGKKKMDAGDLVDYYSDLVKTFPIASIEDGMAEDDWDGWKLLMEKLSKKVQLIGDDMLVTNPERIEKAVEQKAANALLLKVNQIGTISESLKAAKIAQDNKWNVIVSHRSGETEDPFISDLVVGLSASQIKTGSPARSERVAKYNRLLRIQEELEKSTYAGPDF